MAKITVKQKDIEALEFKADIAYNMLQNALSAPGLPWVLSSAQNLYQHDLGHCVENVAGRCTSRGAMKLNKGGKRASKIEKYILQYALMCNKSSHEMNHFDIEIHENPEDNMGGLKAYFEARDDRTSDIGLLFRMIAIKSEDLRKQKRYDLILNAMDYVREKYKPK